MTDSNNLNQLRQLKKNGIGTIDIKAIAIDQDAASVLAKPTVDDAATRAFLIYYEAFVDSSINDQMLWQSQAFHANEEQPPAVRPHSLTKVGFVGGGLATLAIASALVPKETVQRVTSTAQKLVTNAQPKASAPRSKVSVAAGLNSIAPASSIVEFSNSSTASMAKVTVPRVISPAIRAPLPGQIISRQNVEVRSTPDSALLQDTTATPKRNKQSSSAAILAKAPNNLTANSLINSPTDNSTNSPTDNSTNSQTNSQALSSSSLPSLDSTLASQDPSAAKQPSTVSKVNDALFSARPQDGAQQKPSSQALASTTPMPPTEKTKTFLQSSAAGGIKQGAKPPEVVRLLPTLVAAITNPLKAERSPTAALNPPQSASNSAPVGLPKSQPAAKQKAISGKLSQPLNQAIDSAQTIQDFLQLSQKIPTNAPVAIVSLTPQAAIAVPNSSQLETFQVFRLPTVTYQKAWFALTKTTERSDSAPRFGFIDYQQRAIVLPSS